MTERKRCEGLKKDGSPCKQWPRQGQRFCGDHDPRVTAALGGKAEQPRKSGRANREFAWIATLLALLIAAIGASPVIEGKIEARRQRRIPKVDVQIDASYGNNVSPIRFIFQNFSSNEVMNATAVIKVDFERLPEEFRAVISDNLQFVDIGSIPSLRSHPFAPHSIFRSNMPTQDAEITMAVRFSYLGKSVIKYFGFQAKRYKEDLRWVAQVPSSNSIVKLHEMEKESH